MECTDPVFTIIEENEENLRLLTSTPPPHRFSGHLELIAFWPYLNLRKWGRKNAQMKQMRRKKNEEESYFLSLVWIREKYNGEKKLYSKIVSFVWKIENELSKEKYIILRPKYNCQVSLWPANANETFQKNSVKNEGDIQLGALSTFLNFPIPTQNSISKLFSFVTVPKFTGICETLEPQIKLSIKILDST